jgi:hypothetical protein
VIRAQEQDSLRDLVSASQPPDGHIDEPAQLVILSDVGLLKTTDGPRQRVATVARPRGHDDVHPGSL